MNHFLPTLTTDSADTPSIDTPAGIDPIDQLPDYTDVTDGFDPSDEQRRVFGFVEQGEGHGIVKAAAGSGKTATLLGCARLTDDGDRTLVAAFNRSVRDELEDRLTGSGARVESFHSLGRSLLSNHLEISDSGPVRGKLKKILWETLDANEYEDVSTAADEIEDLADMARHTLTDPGDAAALKEMAAEYDLPWEEGYGEGVAAALERSTEKARRQGRIDYTDMVYLPVRLGMTREMFDWVLVDEAQDLSATQRRLVQEVCKGGGRMLFVGDPNQAIYGFRGADPSSIGRIEAETGATSLALTTTFRCPRQHVTKAQEVVPTIRAREEAPKGVIDEAYVEALPEIAEPGDLVLSRRNAPLIRRCLQLLEEGTRAYVQDRSIAKGLVDVVDEATDRSSGGVQELGTGLERVEAKAATIADGSGTDAERIRQRAKAAKEIWARTGPDSLDQLKGILRTQAQPDKETAVRFSTVHRAKGQEAGRVFLLYPEEIGQAKSSIHWKQKQAQNCRYVALTRAQKSLIFLRETEEAGREVSEAPETDGWIRIAPQPLQRGDRLQHREYGVGTVITVDEAREGEVILRFDTDYGLQSVDQHRPAFKRVDETREHTDRTGKEPADI